MSVTLSNTFIGVPRCPFTQASLKNEGCSFVKSYNTVVYTVITCIEMGCNLKKTANFFKSSCVFEKLIKIEN